MKPNKSIDGLVTRDAKKTVPKSKSKRPAAKPSSSRKPKTQPSKTTSVKNPVSAPTPAPTIAEELAPESTIQDTREQTVEDFLTPVQAFNLDTPTDEKSTNQEDTTTDMKPTTEPSAKPAKAKKSSKPHHKKPHKARRIIITIIILILLVIIGFGTWLVLWGNDIIAKITGGQGNIFDLMTFMDESYDPLKTDENGRTNILAFGTSGYNMEGDEGSGIHDGAQLTDSIMLISIDQETGDVAMLSLPRDLKASPTCTATGKINEVYWCANMDGNDETAGATALMNEVSNILGVDIQYYAHINWGSLVSIVDILGGITVTLDEPIEDYWFTGSVYEAGIPYELTGIEAVALARARHGTIGGDFSRGASQQKILIGIKDKVLEKDLSISDLVGLASTLGDNLRTNFSVEELKTLAHLTTEFDFDNMRQISLYSTENNIYLMTTGEINGISYVLPYGGAYYYTAIQDYVGSMLSSDPRTYENPSIIILNATDEAGLAASERTKLETEGYTIETIDNTTGTFPDKYTIYSLTDKTPGTAELLEEYYGITIKPASELPEGITNDYDFVIVLGPSSPDKNTE